MSVDCRQVNVLNEALERVGWPRRDTVLLEQHLRFNLDLYRFRLLARGSGWQAFFVELSVQAELDKEALSFTVNVYRQDLQSQPLCVFRHNRDMPRLSAFRLDLIFSAFKIQLRSFRVKQNLAADFDMRNILLFDLTAQSAGTHL